MGGFSTSLCRIACVAAALAGCGSTDLIPHGGAPGPGTFAVYVRGDLTARTFGDGFSGQTPSQMTMGLGRFDLLRSATDPSPVTVFDHGAQGVEVNLLGRTLAGYGRLSALASGTYTHGRALLTMARATVDATAHAQGLGLPGKLTLLGALSDTTIDGQPWTQGQGKYTFAAGGGFTTSQTGPLPPLPSTAGGAIVQDGNRAWLVFSLPAPLTVNPASTIAMTATIVYEVYESFRWQDQPTAGYATGVFDLEAASFEPVRNFGATGYRIEVEPAG
jgi:hypothetical protein